MTRINAVWSPSAGFRCLDAFAFSVVAFTGSQGAVFVATLPQHSGGGYC